MRSLLLLLLTSFSTIAATPTNQIKVEQVGYLSGAQKIAFVVSAVPAAEFTVRRKQDDSLVFHGKLSAPVDDSDTGDRVQSADFTSLVKNGTYYLQVPGVGRSWDFTIAPNVYARAFYVSMRSFYGQRCGTAVDLGPEFPGYKHGACHLVGAYHQSSGKNGPHESARGWHDAGDYGRYVVNSGISTGTLLWTWEIFGARIKNVNLNIPESGNGTPDLLNEVRWNLDWMLTMQDADGGVWHKQTSEKFAPFVMPEVDSSISYVIGTNQEPYKSSCATADFAAVMAIAARAYQPFDAVYAQKCLAAAEKAWAWLQKYPDITFRNSSGVITGGYGDNVCGDELLWASAELWRTTGKEPYENYFLDQFGLFVTELRPVGPPSWPRVAPLGLWTYVLGGGKNQDAITTIRQATKKAADEIVDRTSHNGYRISMTTKDFGWGSNGVAANYGLQLLVANAIRPDAHYVETAAENLHYLLGRNTFSLSWVTQLGENPFRHPHHRPSAADKNPEPWPGLLSGGPNPSRQDAAMSKLPNVPPAKMYLDEQESYASNEVAINWNAPLVFLLAGMLKEKVAGDSSITTFTTAPSRARQLTGKKPSVSLQMALGTEPSSQTLFDDFNYSNYKQLAKHGWIIRTAAGWPGVPGATWGNKGVSLLGDPDQRGNRLLRMTSSTDGTGANSHQTQICHQRKYMEGTYAARVRFVDIPTDGPSGDQLVESFYTISPLKAPMDPDYSELDFEYLPNGGWGSDGPTLFVTSWRTFSPEPNWKKDNVFNSTSGSKAGWHTLVTQVSDGKVKYFIDGKALADHGGQYYPRSLMSINFNLWFIKDGTVKSNDVRQYREDIDWVFHEAKRLLTPEEVEAKVGALRRRSVKFQDTVPAPLPALTSPCDY